MYNQWKKREYFYSIIKYKLTKCFPSFKQLDDLPEHESVVLVVPNQTILEAEWTITEEIYIQDLTPWRRSGTVNVGTLGLYGMARSTGRSHYFAYPFSYKIYYSISSLNVFFRNAEHHIVDCHDRTTQYRQWCDFHVRPYRLISHIIGNLQLGPSFW